jgi:hypothetical protein
MLSKSTELSDSTSALDRPIAWVMRVLTIPVLISDGDTRRVRLSTCISVAHENFFGARPFQRREWENNSDHDRPDSDARTSSPRVGSRRAERKWRKRIASTCRDSASYKFDGKHARRPPVSKQHRYLPFERFSWCL